MVCDFKSSMLRYMLWNDLCYEMINVLISVIKCLLVRDAWGDYAWYGDSHTVPVRATHD